jgi:hypothetical protein
VETEPPAPRSDGWFSVPEGERDDAAIGGWWRRRRLFYNAVVLPSLFLGICLNQIVWETFLATEAEFSDDGPFGLLGQLCCGACVIPLVVNVAYTFGEIVERWAAKRRSNGTHRLAATLFRLGFGFSLFVAFFPPGVQLTLAALRGFRPPRSPEFQGAPPYSRQSATKTFVSPATLP